MGAGMETGRGWYKMAALCCRRWFSRGYWFSRCYSSTASNRGGAMSGIVGRIKATGPLSVSCYMKECLLSPAAGYYRRDHIIGSEGDYITSPELSQVFGELIGVWVVGDWMTHGSDHCHLIEVGPGRGSLMKDMIRVFDKLQYKLPHLSIHLVENSIKMAATQYSTLTNNTYTCSSKLPDPVVLHDDVTVAWYTSIKEVPQGYSYIIANELFDALPVHQFKMTDDGWMEVMVDIDKENDGLKFVLSKTPSSIAYTSLLGDGCMEGEVSVEGLMMADLIADRLNQDGGAALIVDYGEETINNFTLRGFSNHKEVHILNNPGEADLTADVNFGMLSNHIASRGCSCYGPITQNAFLHKMGIRQRIDALLKNSTIAQAESLIKGYEMLTSPAKMGQRFKFLCVTDSSSHIPTPF